MRADNEKMEAAILESLRSLQAKGVYARLSRLTHLTDGNDREMDRHLQRMRRNGRVQYDSKRGWVVT